MTLFWTRTWDALAGALFPTPCVSCHGLIDAHDPPLCGNCWARIPRVQGPCCLCGVPVPGSPDEPCGRCRRGRSPVSRGASLGLYEGPLRDCVVALKYKGRHRSARGLGARMLEDRRCQAVLEGADLLIAVPLHVERLRDRGFNQSDLLVNALSRGGRVRVCRDLVRARATRSQTDLSAAARRHNVRSAFVVESDVALRGATVVLVDDVTTTGATLRECARTLRRHGVADVRSITVARAE